MGSLLLRYCVQKQQQQQYRIASYANCSAHTVQTHIKVVLVLFKVSAVIIIISVLSILEPEKEEESETTKSKASVSQKHKCVCSSEQSRVKYSLNFFTQRDKSSLLYTVNRRCSNLDFNFFLNLHQNCSGFDGRKNLFAIL